MKPPLKRKNPNTPAPHPSFCIATLYRPPGPYSLFLQEFADFVADFVKYTDNILIMGDFHIHVDDLTDPLTIDFKGFTQVVSKPTHLHSLTLDLVLTREIVITDFLEFFDHEIYVIMDKRQISRRQITMNTQSSSIPSTLHVEALTHLNAISM